MPSSALAPRHLRRWPLSAAASLVFAGSASAGLSAQSPSGLEFASAIASHSQPSCGVAALTSVGAHWPQASVRLLSGPITGSDPALQWRPRIALDLASADHRNWRVRGSGVIGPIDQRCDTQREQTRGWLEISRRLGRSTFALSAGTGARETFDPSRERQGITLSFARAYQARAFGIDVRAFETERTVLGYFSRALMQPDSVRVDSAGGWVPTTRTIVVRDSSMRRNQAGMLGLNAHWIEQHGRFVFTFRVGGAGEVRSQRVQAANGDSLPAGTSPRAFQIQMWAAAGVDARVSERLTAALTFAALPRDLSGGLRASRAATLGMTVSTGGLRRKRAESEAEGGHVFEMTRLAVSSEAASVFARDSGYVRIRVRNPRAASIEVSGDAFGWQPIALMRTRNGWWERDVPLGAGTYRISMRVDGGRWTAPPGFPALNDEFGSEASLVSVP